MIRTEKQALIEELSDRFAQNSFFYIVDSSGMSVAAINAFRRLCFSQGMPFKVYKNTLIRKALDRLDGDTAAMEVALKGQSGILFSKESGAAPAKLLKQYHRTLTLKKGQIPKPVLKGAYLDSDLYIGAQNLDSLTTIKGKQELLGELIGLLQSPAKNVISALQSGGNKLAGILKTLSEKE
ncbi:MAG: 50S ribosomal protein L10 [Hymenobacteraceae bacterium]|nr:50S ribosomal protein L10 [Hymenobacteraceae bacterium]